MIGCMFFYFHFFQQDHREMAVEEEVEALPELDISAAVSRIDTIASAPQRPTNYQENVLSSLHRGIDSSWPADFIIDPRHGVLAFPAVVFILGILPAFFSKTCTVLVVDLVYILAGSIGSVFKDRSSEGYLWKSSK